MKVVLDFDRVLFDTDRLIADMENAGITTARGPALIEAINQAGLDWERYVFEGVKEYLQSTDDDVYIVSSYVSRYQNDNEQPVEDLQFWQTEKIKASGLATHVKEVFVVGNEKADMLETLYNQWPDEQKVFLDDESDHVGVAKEIGFETMWFRTIRNAHKTNPEGTPYTVEAAETKTFKGFLDWKQSLEIEI